MSDTITSQNLFEFLKANLPEKFIKPNKDIRVSDFANASGLTRVTIYNFEHIENAKDGKKIHIDTAQKLINAAEGKIKLDDILEFVTSV